MSILSYVKTIWKAGTEGGTPISPANLNNIENGIEQATEQINNNTNALLTRKVTDLNSATEFGFYTYDNTALNKPTEYGGTVAVYPYSDVYLTQVVHSNSSSGDHVVYVRTRGLNGFNGWTNLDEPEIIPVNLNLYSTEALSVSTSIINTGNAITISPKSSALLTAVFNNRSADGANVSLGFGSSKTELNYERSELTNIRQFKSYMHTTVFNNAYNASQTLYYNIVASKTISIMYASVRGVIFKNIF